MSSRPCRAARGWCRWWASGDEWHERTVTTARQQWRRADGRRRVCRRRRADGKMSDDGDEASSVCMCVSDEWMNDRLVDEWWASSSDDVWIGKWATLEESSGLVFIGTEGSSGGPAVGAPAHVLIVGSCPWKWERGWLLSLFYLFNH